MREPKSPSFLTRRSALARSARTLLACAAAALTLPLLAAGCGGSGDAAGSSDNAVVITRATENTFSEDAKILAARRAAGAWLLAAEAARLDADLDRVRKSYPAVGEIHAFRDFDLHDLLVRIKTTAPWRAKWRAGEILTGEAALDALLQEYGPTRVDAQPLLTVADEEWYVLHFEQSLNTEKLMPLFATVHPDVLGANANRSLGDGDNITVADAAGGARTYTFSRGWGDCPAGCIDRHYWEFAVPADGEPTLTREWGSELQ